MIVGFLIFDNAVPPVLKGAEVELHAGIHHTDDPAEALVELRAVAAKSFATKMPIASVVVPIADDIIVEEALNILERDLGDEPIRPEDFNLLNLAQLPIDKALKPLHVEYPADKDGWKQNYQVFNHSFYLRMKLMIEEAKSPSEVLEGLNMMFAEFGTAHMTGNVLADEIMAAAVSQEEKRKAQQWINLGL